MRVGRVARSDTHKSVRASVSWLAVTTWERVQMSCCLGTRVMSSLTDSRCTADTDCRALASKHCTGCRGSWCWQPGGSAVTSLRWYAFHGVEAPAWRWCPYTGAYVMELMLHLQARGCTGQWVRIWTNILSFSSVTIAPAPVPLQWIGHVRPGRPLTTACVEHTHTHTCIHADNKCTNTIRRAADHKKSLRHEIDESSRHSVCHRHQTNLAQVHRGFIDIRLSTHR